MNIDYPSTEGMYQFGVYTCQRCKQEYIVNDGTWRRCSPEFCHECLAYLDQQHALIPDPEPKQ